MNIEKLLRNASHILIAKSACLKKRSNILIICGPHNKEFAEYIALESYGAGSYPHIWEFDEALLGRCSEEVPGEALSVVPGHVRSLVDDSDRVIWLSQFEDMERISPDIRSGIYSFGTGSTRSYRASPAYK